MSSSKLDWIEFTAHGLYQADCRERGVIGVAWLCLRDDVAIKYLTLAQRGFTRWVELEKAAAALRNSGKEP